MDENSAIEIDEKPEIESDFQYSSEKSLISQGAEARLFRCCYLGKDAILKERFVKNYRHSELDRHLTKERIRNESRSILKCKQVGIDVPTIYFLNTETNGIIFEFIEGLTAKDFIEKTRSEVDKESFERIMQTLGYNIGQVIGKLHSSGISHGDLTTSNMILRQSDPARVCLIDFGLAASRINHEDFGVDLYVLERAIRTTHVGIDFFMDKILEGYASAQWKGSKEALKKLNEVRLRGRKREMIG
ncbi:Non-specific serine/threonine protein kinase [Aphelenchoides bicaudatus]|nr:Non-specific serine/threonine protein kinase [Aphelenchoides bicaudatus]